MIQHLRGKYPTSFWADPSVFFTDGPVVNLGADFGLMPSKFEPGGIVQHEFFVAGTPVIAFKTGGLKDSVHEFNRTTLKGNGFTFETYSRDDMLYAIHRAMDVFVSTQEGSMDLSLYEQLRYNAAHSPMDVSVVAREWYREFCRLRGVLSSDLMTLFTYDGKHRGVYTRVLLVGSFNDWAEEDGIALDFCPDSNTFTALVHITPGTYTYKFIVDGEWQLAPGFPTLPDALGVLNNVITVVGHDAV